MIAPVLAGIAIWLIAKNFGTDTGLICFCIYILLLYRYRN